MKKKNRIQMATIVEGPIIYETKEGERAYCIQYKANEFSLSAISNLTRKMAWDLETLTNVNELVKQIEAGNSNIFSVSKLIIHDGEGQKMVHPNMYIVVKKEDFDIEDEQERRKAKCIILEQKDFLYHYSPVIEV